MSRQVFAREAAKDVRDLDHDGADASEAGHQSVEDGFERDAGRFGEVGIDRGGGDMDVTEQDLYDPRIHASFEQSRRIAVAQGVGRDPPSDSSRAGGVLESAAQHLLVGRVGTQMIGKEPARIAMSSPERSQVIQDRSRQWHKPLSIALADDAKLKIGAVDGADFQGRGFAYAQAAGVHEGEAGLVNRVSHAAQQRPDLFVRQDLGKP